MSNFGKYFCGNMISEYGRKNGRVDYATFAKAFDAVLNNNIMADLESAGYYFDIEAGMVDNSEEIEALEEERDALGIVERWTASGKSYEDEDGNEASPEAVARLEEIEEKIDELREEEDPGEIFQYYIVSSYGADLIRDYNVGTLFYCEAVDLYIWGVHHWGTSWDYVLTSIPCDIDPDARA